MKTSRYSILLAVAAIGCVHVASGQVRDSTSGMDMITIGGEVEHPLRLSAHDLRQFPRDSVRVREHDGTETLFEGVAVIGLLQKAGATLGKNLRGKALANYLLAEASDGYRVVYAMAEIDTEFTSQIVLLADRMDHAPLPPSVGPFRIIVPNEKRHARWIRQVWSLTIVPAKELPEKKEK